MSKGKKLGIIAIAVAIFIVLVLMLSAVEKGAGGNIDGIEDALWFSVVTLTTVGYGDLTPVTGAGRVIGVILVIASLGLLSAIISGIFSYISGYMLHFRKLKASRMRNWNIFIGENPGANALAENIIAEGSEEVIIFLKEEQGFEIKSESELRFCVRGQIERLLDIKKGNDEEVSNVNVFVFDEGGWKNYMRAEEISKYKGCKVYCRSQAELSKNIDNLQIFDEQTSLARGYWNTHPLKENEKDLVFIGLGNYGKAVLKQALTVNVFGPFRKLNYHVVGDEKEFCGLHYELFGNAKRISEEPLSYRFRESPEDNITFYRHLFELEPKTIINADRVIICMESDAENVEVYDRIQHFYPVKGQIHVRANEDIVTDKVVLFGSNRAIYTKELIIKDRLNILAKELNEIYRQSVGGNAPAFEELSVFKKQSNIAAADHLIVKCRILLGDEMNDLSPAEICKNAYERYVKETAAEEKADLFRQIEHDRWVRFHILNNWKYDEFRNNEERKHPLIVPFGSLSKEEQEKDDYAWELLGKVKNIK